jgi:hypothetical protein
MTWSSEPLSGTIVSSAYLTPAQYAAQGLGMSVSFNMATFFNTQAAPSTAPVNSFAPTTTDFIDDWISRALAAKAKYVMFTAKHRTNLTSSPSFCAWPTATYSYNVSQTSWYQTGGGFDIVQQFTFKARAAGLNIVLYWQPSGDTRATCEAQLIELTSNYGPIQGIWFDGPKIHTGDVSPWPDAPTMLAFMHSLQPGILLIANVHPAGPGFDLGHTDIFEYEGPSITVPPGNTSPAEQINSIFKSSAVAGISGANSFFFYETFIPNTTATGGTLNTVTLPGGSATNGYYTGCDVIINSGTGAGQRLTVQSYIGSTGVFTMTTNWATIPDTTSVCTVLGQLHTAAELQTNLTTDNSNTAAFLINASPDTSGHIPADQAALLAAFGALH